MRITGGPELGTEAADVVRQAASLARRRGHAQVTPLHVASAMLSTAGAGGVLRAACVRCQSDPLQCDALELCVGAALDRLRPPRSATQHGGGGGDHVIPAPSNAFAAALKRAHARQRRGSADGGLGQRLGIKVELEQLVISILDDPSVDRVMREVGLSSSQVRANVQDAVSRTITRAGHTSLENVTELHQLVVDGDVLHGSLSCVSEEQAGSGLPYDGTEMVATLTIAPALLPSWLRRSQGPATAGSARRAASPPQAQGTRRQRRFTELVAENLKIMCGALETRVPRSRDIVPAISTAVLWCRAGMTKRSSSPEAGCTVATWLLFCGRDEVGKVEMAKELARLVFGSYSEFTMVSSDSAMSSDQLTHKRHRSWGDCDGDGLVGAKLLDAILENPHRVIMISGISRLDHESSTRVRSAVADATMRGHNGDVVSLEDAIVVLSSQLFDPGSLTSPPPFKRRASEISSRRRFSLDLNARAEECEEEKDDSSGNDDRRIEDAMDGVFLFD